MHACNYARLRYLVRCYPTRCDSAAPTKNVRKFVSFCMYACYITNGQESPFVEDDG